MQALLFALVSASLRVDANTLDLKERPVSKVIGLLENMQAELQKEAEQDKELYEKLSCWCEVNGKAKTAAIAEAVRRIAALEADIERFTATSASLESSIATLKEEIAAATNALDKASALRAKELAEFNADEKDLINSIRALDGAITTLEKHQSFLQGTAKSVSVVQMLDVHTLIHAVQKAKLAPAQKKTMEAFLQQPAGFKSYSGQSGAIFGILKQMKETFESNMSQSQKDEMTAADDFAALKSAKTSEINAATNMVDSQMQELADTDEANAAAAQNLSDTKEALDADTIFLADLKKRCASADQEYEARTQMRNEEIQAVSETIGILNADDSHDLMGKTLGFFAIDTKRAQAVKALQQLAGKTGSVAVAQLAMVAKLDAFVKVQQAIDEMVTALKQEMQDEVQHRDFCIKELAENGQEQAVTQDAISDLTAELGDLDSTIDTLTTELKSANAQMAQMKIQMQRASEDRELENSDFQTAVAEQREVQAILKKAMARLQEFYGDGLAADAVGGDGKSGSELLQQEPGAAAPPPPAGFAKYEKKGGRGIMSMLQTIVDEAKQMELDALKAEQDSHSAYEEYMQDSNKSIKKLMKAVADKSAQKAAADAREIAAKADRTGALDKGESLQKRKATLHQTCDYVTENFDARQEARGAEIQALGEAKAILSGAA